MSSRKPTLIVIPGAWISNEAYVEWTKRINFEYPIIFADTPTAGMHPPSKDMSEDITAMRDIVTKAIGPEGNDVILIMHSIGGVATNEGVIGLTRDERAKEGKSGGIIGNIYVASVQPPVGVTQMEWMMQWFAASPAREEVRRKLDRGAVYNEDGSVDKEDPQTLYNDLDEETGKYWVSKHRSAPLAMFGVKITNNLWERVPSYYIWCERDTTVTGELLEEFANRLATSEAHILKLQSDHVPFLSHPEELGALVRKAIDGITGQ